jgi:hypothetical protein
VSELSERITNYLASGGLWNPDLMDHDKVRQLLMDCRTHLDSAPAWHQRPTVPGIWVFTYRGGGRQVIEVEDLPWWQSGDRCLCCYGPIPIPEGE